MAIMDRVRSAVLDRFDVDVVPRGEIRELRETAEEFSIFRDEAEELAYTALNYVGGRPSEMKPIARRRLTQRSRIALMQDPLAGAEAELLANFSFGKGVPIPEADDPDVSEEIRKGWTHPINDQKLFGYAAQRHRSNELLTSSNLFGVAYPGADGVVFGTLDADRVIDIYTDPEDEEVPLWYVVEEPVRTVWDFGTHTHIPDPNQQRGVGPNGRAVRYWKHWRNVEVVNRARAKAGKPPVKDPPPQFQATGLVEHFAINRIGRSLFGTPRWARTLRFYSAMNILTESHVEMAQAASTLIAQTTMSGMSGTDEGIARAANNVLAQTGEIGAARFGTGTPPTDLLRNGTIPVAPGSFLEGNESAKVEALNLGSGAGQMLQTAQIVRAPISAASSFGQHYLGDSSTANLATATSLELPTTFAIQAWQRISEQVQSWGTDMILNNSLRRGVLDEALDRQVDAEGDTGETEWEEPEREEGEPDEAFAERVREARDAFEETEEDRERERALRKLEVLRDGHRFAYRIAFPYPGRRMLADVMTAATTFQATFNAQGTNVEKERDALLFVAREGFMLDDPQGAVDRWLPPEAGDAVVRNALSTTQSAVAGAQGGIGPDGRPLDPTAGGQVPGVGGPPGGGGPGVPGEGDVPKNVRGLFEALGSLSESDAQRVYRDVFGDLSDALEAYKAPGEATGH